MCIKYEQPSSATDMLICPAQTPESADRFQQQYADYTKPSKVITSLFPGAVVGIDNWGHAPAELLYVDEFIHVQRCVPKRAREFSAGRLCARHALNELGINRFPLLVSDDRRPLWPAGIVGSITHTDNYCGVVVARSNDYRSLGLDAIDLGSNFSEKDWRILFTESEIEALLGEQRSERQRTCAAIFSAKEAFYKCQYGLTGQFLEFQAVSVGFFGQEFIVTPSTWRGLEQIYTGPLIGSFVETQGMIVCSFFLRAENGAGSISRAGS